MSIEENNPSEMNEEIIENYLDASLLELMKSIEN